jgi:uncharacterized protein (TIGR02001 family)
MGAALVGVPVVAFAAEEPTGPFGGNIAGTVGFVTDYKYRGISQSGNDPAVQGSLEYSIPVAGEAAVAYASLWGSSINFGGNLETDWTAGVRGVVNGFGYDVNVLYYYYPGSNSGANLDFVEVGGKLSYDFGFVVPYVGFRYSPDFQGNAAGNTGHAEFYTAGATVPLSYGMLTDYSVVLMGEVSRQKIQDNARWGTPDYTTWTVGISATAFTLNWALQYIDTDMNKAECFGGSNVCEGRAVFSVSKTF